MGPRPHTNALTKLQAPGGDPFPASVGASLPTGAACCSSHGTTWIEVTEQMVVAFSWELPGYTGTSDPDIKAHSSLSSPLAIWPVSPGSVPSQRLCGVFPSRGWAGLLVRKEMCIALHRQKGTLAHSPAPPFRECSEHPGVPGSLVDAILGVITDAISQMETWRKEQHDPGTQSA